MEIHVLKFEDSMYADDRQPENFFISTCFLHERSIFVHFWPREMPTHCGVYSSDGFAGDNVKDTLTAISIRPDVFGLFYATFSVCRNGDVHADFYYDGNIVQFIVECVVAFFTSLFWNLVFNELINLLRTVFFWDANNLKFLYARVNDLIYTHQNYIFFFRLVFIFQQRKRLFCVDCLRNYNQTKRLANEMNGVDSKIVLVDYG